MPFLIVPRGRSLGERELRALGARACPYDGSLAVRLESASHAVLGTSLTRTGPAGVAGARNGGTADFAIEPSGQGLVVRTDPLGTLPVWYASTPAGWIAGPEVKVLAAFVDPRPRPSAELLAPGARAPDWSPYERVRRLPPGATLFLGADGPRVEGRPRAFELPRRAGFGVDELAAALASAPLAVDEPLGAFVSGGIDSSIGCALGRRRGAVRTYSLGTAHGNEFPAARALAAALGCVHREVELDAADVRATIDRVVFENEVFDGLTVEVLVQLAALSEAARGDCRTILTGYGSDLLFDGMLRHAAYMRAVGLATTPELIERTRWTGELAPFVAWSRGLAFRHVFWEPTIMDAALSLPRELCFVDGVEKSGLRAAAVAAELLPEALAYRRKTGLSDGTGAHHLVSDALGVDETYGYDAKSVALVPRFRALFELERFAP